MNAITHKLIKKGWKKKDISHAIKIIEKARLRKHPHVKFMDQAAIWFSWLTAILGNLIISISLIPFLLALNNFSLYLVIITLGISFGLLFELLIRTVWNLEKKHHILLMTIVPLIASINLILIVLFSNRLEEIMSIQNPQNPFITAIVYAVSFMLPYTIYQFFIKK